MGRRYTEDSLQRRQSLSFDVGGYESYEVARLSREHAVETRPLQGQDKILGEPSREAKRGPTWEPRRPDTVWGPPWAQRRSRGLAEPPEPRSPEAAAPGPEGQAGAEPAVFGADPVDRPPPCPCAVTAHHSAARRAHRPTALGTGQAHKTLGLQGPAKLAAPPLSPRVLHMLQYFFISRARKVKGNSPT